MNEGSEPTNTIRILGEHYNLSVQDCTLLSHGLNDSYLVASNGDRYVLRIYRPNWRTGDEISFELDYIQHLRDNLVGVSYPLPDTKGNLAIPYTLNGTATWAALFTFASGDEPKMNIADSRHMGVAAGKLHRVSDTFIPQNDRFTLDIPHLLEEPVQALEAILKNYTTEQGIISSAARLLTKQINELKPQLDWGACHGDLHDWNAHISKAGEVTLFDFDCCGFGWRAYDIAVFRWAIRKEPNAEALWQAFLEGYTSERALNNADLEAVPIFTAIRDIWLAGLHAANPDVFGPNILNEHYLEDLCTSLQKYKVYHSI